MYMIVSLCLVAALSGCGTQFSDNTNLNATGDALSPETTAAPTAAPETAPAAADETKLPLIVNNMLFWFHSGVGAWSTRIELATDGTFRGSFSDQDSVMNTDEYPNGTVYICNFSGTFVEIEQINEYSYRMILSDLALEQAPGEEWIEVGYRYVACTPYGIDGGNEFILYLPDTPLSEVSEEMLSWWPYRFDQENVYTNLSCYGVLNVSTGHAFFSN